MTCNTDRFNKRHTNDREKTRPDQPFSTVLLPGKKFASVFHERLERTEFVNPRSIVDELLLLGTVATGNE